jgi:Cytochrome P460
MRYRIVALGILFAAGALHAAAPPPVIFPEGYRHWQHVKSMLIEPGHPLAGLVEGLHHIYANPKAMAGYSTGHYANGAIIVLDLLTPVQADKALTEGARKAVIVMVRDSKAYASTGGWGFEVFAGDSKTDRQIGEAANTKCFACHEAQKAHGYVFSEYRR